MKTILGLDLGTNSIGWALVKEAETTDEKSEIIRLGARIINYDNFVSTETGKEIKGDPADYFRGGKGVSTCAGRTQKRSARRNLQRYKLRRENLIEILKENGFISDETILSENGNSTTFETYRLRAKSASEEITLEQFARVLLMINKKRGYKSSRKAKGTEDGTLIDGMEIAKRLYNENLTPGQLCLQLINERKKYLPDFYRSDLQTEFDRIWAKQQEFYPEILTDELRKELIGKKRDAVYAICVKRFVWKETHTVWNNDEGKNEQVEKEHTIVGFKRNGNTHEQKVENLVWRAKGLTDKLHLEEIVFVLQEINTKINSSSGYLGAISDRSKELYFNKQTVGQYQMSVLDKNPNTSLRNMVFYRKDYEDEFDTLWKTQSKFHKGLTDELGQEIKDVVIFYQRRLKSQKGLISFCEFESRQIEVEIDGSKKIKTVGSRVIPRSSPLFQEFKIWQILNNIEVSVSGKKVKRKKKSNGMESLFAETENTLELEGKRLLFQEEKELLANELSIKKKMSKTEVLKLLFDNPQELDLNFKEIQGNTTQAELFGAYKTIIERSGHSIDVEKRPAEEILKSIEEIFDALGIHTDILNFYSEKSLDDQPMYKLWHLLYSFEGDDSNTGNEKLIAKLMSGYGFDKDSAKILANVTFLDDYGSLSAKAIRKILPHLKDGFSYGGRTLYNGKEEPSACVMAGYGKHSKSSLNKEEIENKVLKDKLDILPKNSLRNPVVEKILNQMVNVINSIIDTYGKPDEIRVELARELKKNADERAKLTDAVNKNTKAHEEYAKILTKPISEGGQFGLKRVSRNDIIRYKLWIELKATGFHTLYSNTYISPAKLFTGEFDIEHIIPQSRLFDDSFSNKTLEKRDVNIKKGNQTAYDFVNENYGDDGLTDYLNRVEMLYNVKSRDNADEEAKTAGTISKTKYNKLKLTESDIPDGFIERDLRNTQYIAKKALSMLNEISRRVVATIGSITDELREDWQLINIMQELNWNKYAKLGLTEIIEVEDKQNEGNIHKVPRIKEWTKRNDHRHHAMDALTVAFTKDVYIQYFNNKNASFIANSNEYAIKNKYFENGKAIPPMLLDEFRTEAKKHLENTLISIKAKNKVVTTNVNKAKNKKITEIVKDGETKIVKGQVVSTPRGQLHNETIYGSQKQYVVKEEAVNAKFDSVKIATVSRPIYREALQKRLQQFDNDAKKAFTGKNALSKNPIWLDEAQTVSVPEKVKTVSFETLYTIRKAISPDLKLDKVIDEKIKKVLQKRLDDFGGNTKNAFSNIEENPIWMNKEKGISIKRVTISGVSNAEALHTRIDKAGQPILDKDGKKQPADFVNTGNNHHVAVYRNPILDKNGETVRDDNGDIKYELIENVVSFYDAIKLKNFGLPIVIKDVKDFWNKVIDRGIDDQLFLQKFPKNEGFEFLFSMKQNEYFVFPQIEKQEKVNEETGEITNEDLVLFNPKDYNEEWFKNPDNYYLISPNLFRVQKFTIKDYFFRHHLETNVQDNTSLKGITWRREGLSGIREIVKVRLNHVGEIVSVGEY